MTIEQIRDVISSGGRVYHKSHSNAVIEVEMDSYNNCIIRATYPEVKGVGNPVQYWPIKDYLETDADGFFFGPGE